jgi:acetate kinase
MILVLNCGSQSIKWKLFNDKLKVIKEGKRTVLNSQGFQNTLEEELNGLKGLEISKIGHRVVHGGPDLAKPIEITEENLKKIEGLSPLAPLHNPFNILGIKACQSIFQNIPQYAVFDTEFFADLPEKTKLYALPEDITKEFGFRRYGFQGTSHEYVAKKAAGNKFKKIKIITCHLGGGASVAAIKNGKAIDTSMGFTPLEGLVMMTRSGNIDAGIVLEMAEKLSIEKTKEILNKESGLKGICGESDMLEVLKKVKTGDRKAKLALEIFVYSIKKYIGSYFAALNGCDVLVFTGAIGLGSSKIRNMVCKDMDFLKKTKVLAVETDEELAIAAKI